MVETGDWLTPRSIGADDPWLEKPPLKFWIVAGAITAGLLPHDEFGLRFFDPLFGSIAFIYVFLIGRLLAGPLCGFIAVFVLFTFQPLLFEHGLRSNDMDAPLVLSFCGGIYHFARWAESDARKEPVHALAVAGYFVLGFMTKFVAVLFLPLVCAAGIAWRRDGLLLLRSRGRDWRAPAILIVAATLPWFVYQAIHSGAQLWQTMVAVHVYERFTGVLDARHLQPWNYYISTTWLELIRAGSHWVGAVGLVVLAIKAWNGRPWLARLVFAWCIVPIALISLGTSKLFHYAYPFLPPIALGAGIVAAALFRFIEPKIAAALGPAATAVGRVFPSERVSRIPVWARVLLLVVAVGAFALSGWTAADGGTVRWKLGDVALLSNSSVVRPLLIGLIAFFLSGYVTTTLSRALAMGIVAIILPVMAYPVEARRLTFVNRPVRTLRDCGLSLKELDPETHAYVPRGELLNHAYYYYLRTVGPWVEDDRPLIDELRDRVVRPSRAAFVILFTTDYERLTRDIPADAAAAHIPPGVSFPGSIAILAPGLLEPCADAAAAEGWAAIPRVPIGGTRE